MKYSELSDEAKQEALSMLKIAIPYLTDEDVEDKALELNDSIEYNEFGSIINEYL